MVPSVCEKLVKLGTEVCTQSGAGESAGLSVPPPEDRNRLRPHVQAPFSGGTGALRL
jgi:hypothetical protein